MFKVKSNSLIKNKNKSFLQKLNLFSKRSKINNKSSIRSKKMASKKMVKELMINKKKYFDSKNIHFNNYFNKKYHVIYRDGRRFFKKKKNKGNISSFSIKHIKNIKHVYRNWKPSVPQLDFNKPFLLKRVFKLYPIYKIRQKYYYIIRGKLKKYNNIFKEKKKNKIKYFLWKTLTKFNSIKIISNEDSFNFFNNYQLKNKNVYHAKKYQQKVNFKIFNKNVFKSASFAKYSYHFFCEKVFSYYVMKKDDLLLDFFYTLKKCNLDYYNKSYQIKFNYDYFYYFYVLLKNRILLKVLYKLKCKNYYNFLIWSNLSIDSSILFKVNKKIYSYIDRNNINKIDSKKFFLNKFAKQTASWTRFLIQHKKWKGKAMYPWGLSLLKKIIVILLKINIQFNSINSRVFLINNSNKYTSQTTQLHILEPSKLKIPKYWFLFITFLKQSLLFKSAVLNKSNNINLYLLKKYYFFFNFIKNYLIKLFSCLKYIFFKQGNDSNIQHYIYKLKFLIFILFYKSFIQFLKIKRKKKIFTKSVVLMNTRYFINRAYKVTYYKYMMRALQYKLKNLWSLKIKDPILQMIQEEGEYNQFYNVFKYNPLLNPKHNSRVQYKRLKYQKLTAYLLKKLTKYEKVNKALLKKKKLVKAAKAKEAQKKTINDLFFSLEYLINKNKERKALWKNKKYNYNKNNIEIGNSNKGYNSNRGYKNKWNKNKWWKKKIFFNKNKWNKNNNKKISNKT